jgi:hypothetical protein
LCVCVCEIYDPYQVLVRTLYRRGVIDIMASNAYDRSRLLIIVAHDLVWLLIITRRDHVQLLVTVGCDCV